MRKKLLIAITGILGISIIVFGSIYLINNATIKSNIKHCQEIFQGSAEDALIAYMLDETKHPENRSHVAVWTLGQLKSEKALPHLMKLSKDDPKGKTCADNHDAELCQYEIHKAIKKIEKSL